MFSLSNIVHTLNLACAGFLFIVLLVALIVFITEKEKKASRRTIPLIIFIPTPFFIAWMLQIPIVSLLLLGLSCFVLILLFLPVKCASDLTDNFPLKRYDERDIMFSRRELKHRTERFEEYYKKYPEKKAADDEFRKEPGLISPDSLFYQPKAFASAESSFQAVELLHKAVDGEVNAQQTPQEPEQITRYLKHWCKKLGALDVGITRLEDYHLYSHKGRRDSYGQKIITDHTFALAFTVEMDQEMVRAAPKASILMESARQYFEAGGIAVQVAAFLRTLGYSARAHIDGNYQLICPLVARDAGLGEIGRMGLLMTPQQGPRVRIGVVTTDLELLTDEYKINHSVIDFCSRCKKCADCCPGQAIPFDNPKEIEGVRRWQINSELCYTYWCKAGTDCGRCMAVCPYSHPDQLMHIFIRWGIRNSFLFRRLAVWLDDFFYGKKPKPHPPPKWL